MLLIICFNFIVIREKLEEKLLKRIPVPPPKLLESASSCVEEESDCRPPKKSRIQERHSNSKDERNRLSSEKIPEKKTVIIKIFQY